MQYGYYSNTPRLQPRLQAMQLRQKILVDAWRAYDGDFEKPLSIKKGMPDDNIIINMAKVICDKGASYLANKPITFALDDNDGTDNPAEKALHDCLKFNRFNTFFQKMALNGGICGHVFIQIIPGKPFPKLVLMDAQYIDVVYRDDDIDEVMAYIIQYNKTDEHGRPIMYRKTIQRVEIDLSEQQYVSTGLASEDSDLDNTPESKWVIFEEHRNGDTATPVATYVDQGRSSWILDKEIPWDYEWPPIIDCQNLPRPNSFWGTPDITTDILNINNQLNFVLSNIGRIIRTHAHPKMWARGMMADKIKIGVEDLIVMPGEKSEMGLLEMTATGIGPALEVYNILKDVLHELSRIPEIATGNMEHVSRLSGVAIAMLYEPILEKTQTKRSLYGDMLIELCRRLLELMNFGPANLVSIRWPELLPKDDYTERQSLQIDRDMGITSKATVAAKLQYNWAQERAQMAAEDKEDADQAEEIGMLAGEPLTTPIIEQQAEMDKAKLVAKGRAQAALDKQTGSKAAPAAKPKVKAHA